MSNRKVSPTRKAPRSHEAFLAAEVKYREAMSLFVERRDWNGAAALFRGFVAEHEHERDVAEMIDRARVHLATCEGKLSPAAPRPTNADDWMLHGVVAANRGDVEGALTAYAQAADAGAPRDKIEYASAAVLALAERQEEALEALKRAIDLNPDHRIYSLSDPDFERLRETAGYVALVDPPSELSYRDSDLMTDDSADLDGFDEELDDDGDPAVEAGEEPEEYGSEDEIT
jgi:tetratricopeptide (TPR) repeat protein